MPKPAAPAYTLRYDLTALRPGQTVLETWPELAAYPAFALHGVGENDKFLQFAIWYSDAGSPHRDLPLEDKKRVCLDAAGIAADDPRRGAVVRWQDAGVVALVSQYVRLQNSLKYALWLHGSESAAQTIEQLSQPIAGAKDKNGDDDEAKTQTAYKTRRDNLDAMFLQVPKLVALGNELFMGDEELREAEQVSQLANTPTAERRAEGRSFIPSPRP